MVICNRLVIFSTNKSCMYDIVEIVLVNTYITHGWDDILSIPILPMAEMIFYQYLYYRYPWLRWYSINTYTTHGRDDILSIPIVEYNLIHKNQSIFLFKMPQYSLVLLKYSNLIHLEYSSLFSSMTSHYVLDQSMICICDRVSEWLLFNTNKQFYNYIIARTSYNQWNDDHIVLDQHT
jgi:hypothetical protein